MGVLGLLGPGLGAGRFESPLYWNSKLDLGFLGPCGRVNLFPSSTRRSGRLDLPERGTHVKKTNCLAAFSLSSSPTVPLFPFRHWNRSRRRSVWEIENRPRFKKWTICEQQSILPITHWGGWRLQVPWVPISNLSPCLLHG